MTEVTRLHIGIGTREGMIDDRCVLGLLDAWHAFPCSLTLARGAYIARNRDMITADALEREDVSHVLFLDSDIVFRAADVTALLELGVDFAFGRYAFKSHERDGPVARACIGRGEANGVQLLEYDRVGGGFVLVTRAALERMVEAYGADLGYTAPGGRRLHGLWWQAGYTTGSNGERIVEGEDYAFCRRWRELGGRIFTRTDVRLGHVGPHVYELGDELPS